MPKKDPSKDSQERATARDMRVFWLNLARAAITGYVAIAACAFTPKAEMTESGAANSGGNLTGTGNATGAGATSGGAGATGSSNSEVNCGAVTQGAQMLPPDILIIQDKSGSMSNNADDQPCNGGCGTNSKWSQVTTAIDQVVSMTDTTVNWGLKFFSDNGSCGAAAAPVVPVGTGSGAAIAAAIGRTTPAGNTPTRDAITNGATYLMGLTDSNPKYLLLATDGLPNCPQGCNVAHPSNMCTMTDNPAEDMAAAQAVATALTAGFKTFVVGIGTTGADNTLNALANAGGMPQTGAATSFYQVTDTASLVTALGSILGRASSCVFDVGAAPNRMTRVNAIDVYGDGALIQHDPTNGWDYSNAAHTQITLYGTTCNAVTTGNIKSVTVTFNCIVN